MLMKIYLIVNKTFLEQNSVEATNPTNQPWPELTQINPNWFVNKLFTPPTCGQRFWLSSYEEDFSLQNYQAKLRELNLLPDGPSFLRFPFIVYVRGLAMHPG